MSVSDVCDAGEKEVEETSGREELVLRGQDRGEPASCSQHGGVSSMWCRVGAGGSL